mmetsp:Transcript_5366/g.13639  ORF Transcript_5366/g.13639 Transcript_5366/m.13639 type:complete len:317 (+) Transcript_5366:31-981(+)
MKNRQISLECFLPGSPCNHQRHATCAFTAAAAEASHRFHALQSCGKGAQSCPCSDLPQREARIGAPLNRVGRRGSLDCDRAGGEGLVLGGGRVCDDEGSDGCSECNRDAHSQLDVWRHVVEQCGVVALLLHPVVCHEALVVPRQVPGLDPLGSVFALENGHEGPALQLSLEDQHLAHRVVHNAHRDRGRCLRIVQGHDTHHALRHLDHGQLRAVRPKDLENPGSQTLHCLDDPLLPIDHDPRPLQLRRSSISSVELPFTRGLTGWARLRGCEAHRAPHCKDGTPRSPLVQQLFKLVAIGRRPEHAQGRAASRRGPP